jgi:2,3-bisphosphoglycerate-independent phosphoglycerate mutase
MMKKKAALIILDGWGIGDGTKSDAIKNANTPYFDQLMADQPHATLKTFGENVGLPEGQMGNSEVGHLNIGAGRIVYQDFAKINKMIADDELKNNAVLTEAILYAEQNNQPFHLMGLVSDGGVHSHEKHLIALVDILEATAIKEIYIHAFTDGRDTDPRSGAKSIKQLEQHLNGKRTKLVSMIGRYYAMDRDHRWERIERAYNLLVKGEGAKTADFAAQAEKFYAQDLTDEFFTAAIIDGGEGRIESGNAVLCFNFRTDRCRQITTALTQEDFPEFGMKTLGLFYATMTKYDEKFKNVHVLYEKDNLVNTLGEVVSSAGLTQLRIAETEKYPHVTFFFSGGREKQFEGEERIVVPSPKVATYDLQPEMSANTVADKVIAAINTSAPNFICLNFANPDMVGHTGVYDAIVKAVETTDDCLNRVAEAALKAGYELIVIADHGNAEKVLQGDGSPHTAHTTNLVPVIYLGSKDLSLSDGILADIAPTLLSLLKVSQPKEMSGKSLL